MNLLFIELLSINIKFIITMTCRKKQHSYSCDIVYHMIDTQKTKLIQGSFMPQYLEFWVFFLFCFVHSDWKHINDQLAHIEYYIIYIAHP